MLHRLTWFLEQPLWCLRFFPLLFFRCHFHSRQSIYDFTLCILFFKQRFQNKYVNVTRSLFEYQLTTSEKNIKLDIIRSCTVVGAGKHASLNDVYNLSRASRRVYARSSLNHCNRLRFKSHVVVFSSRTFSTPVVSTVTLPSLLHAQATHPVVCLSECTYVV